MRIISIIICLLLIISGLSAQGSEVMANAEAAKSTLKLSDVKTGINNNYLGIDLIYSGATLVEPEVRGAGFGFDMFYQSFINNNFSFKVMFELLSNPYNNYIEEIISEYPLVAGTPTERAETNKFDRKENFYNFIIGFTFSYYLYLDKIFGMSKNVNIYPYFSTGLLSSSVYKSYSYQYYKKIPWGEDKAESLWLSTAFTLPLSFGINYLIGKGSSINFDITYLLIFFNQADKEFSYKNLLNIKLGYMFGIDFKL